MVKGVIFDMDGLMFDTERLWDTLWEPACAALGLPLPKQVFGHGWLVMGGGKMVGMLTFREVIKATNARKGKIDSVTVEEVMVRDPVTVEPAMLVDDLRRLMIEKHSRYLPVMEGGVLQGVISFLDVAKAVLEEQSFENKMLKNYIRNWPDGEPAKG